MQDFSHTDAADMHYPVLAERVRYFKENQEGAVHMCRSVEKMINQARIEANAETVQRFMTQNSLSVDEALKTLGMPEAEWDDIKNYIETHAF